MFQKNNKPISASISITNKCNAKCSMCNIWKIHSQDAITPADMLKLPSSLLDINITGGEPFLRNDLVDIILNIKKTCTYARIIISSNGFLTDRILNVVEELKSKKIKVSLAFSLDGIDEMHSQIRGVPNAFEKVINTVEKLKKQGFDDIRFAYTASKDNIMHLDKVYNLAKEKNVEFTMTVVHNSENYYSKSDNIEPDFDELQIQLKPIINQVIKTFNPRKLFRAYYFGGILEYAKKRKRPLKCYSLEQYFFMNPNGDIYPCNILEQKIGNLQESSFDKIWQNDENEKLKKFCLNCNQCWTVCNVKNAVVKNPLKVIKNLLMLVCQTDKN